MSEEIIGTFLTEHPADAYLDRAGNVKKMY